ncbi:MAG: DPP IV N-terminal domain-containing protein [Bacteroidota bacterium]
MRKTLQFVCFILSFFWIYGRQTAFPQTARDSILVDKIVFDSDRDGARQIYIMNTNGTSLKKLTNGPAENMCPSISSDGSEIVFESRRDGNYEVYIMNTDGTGQKRLTNSTEDEYSQEFSPDGSKIFFIKYFNTRSEIWVMNTDGTSQQRLTSNQAHDERPRLSPDEQTIMFISDRDGHYEIYFMNPDGTNQRRFTNSNGNKIFPAWSPDGSRIVYSINTNTGTPAASLYVINSDGTGNSRLTNAAGRSEDPCWSPDGNSIVFQSDRSGGFEIYVMNADGTNQQRVTTNSSWDGWPCWGRIRYPINKYLGQTPPFSTIKRFPPNNLQMLSINGVWSWHGSPVFSPDYKEMFFVKYLHTLDRAEIWHSQLVNNQWTIPEPASFGNQTVTENCPAFSSAGDTLFFYSQRSGEGKVYQCFRQADRSWSVPQILPFNLPSGLDMAWNFSFSKNRTVYFELYDDINNTDLYRSEWVNGSYSEPERLPGQVNSMAGDGCAFIDPDEEYLIFISNRTEGYGLHDIYISYRNRDGIWSQSANLGSSINSIQEDGFPVVSPDGKYMFFNTARAASGDQGYNAYWVSTAFIDLGRPIEPDTTNRIVFSSERDGNPEIYTMYTDGTDLKRLTINSSSDLFPAYSNDGSQIVFSSDREGDFELFLMNADGSNPHKLSDSGIQAGNPDWSPDGSRILFTVSEDIYADEGDIGLINADGSGMQLISGASLGSRPVWSDDGTSIIFCSRRTGFSQIYRMDPDGTGLLQITRSEGDKRNARLSPDGQKIAFTLISPAGTDAQIHVINVDGTSDRILTNDGNANDNPCWSADGRSIVFQTGRFGNTEIYNMDADGKNQLNLSRNDYEDYCPNVIRKASVSGIIDPISRADETGLRNVWPNPAETSVTIEFSAMNTGHVDISLFDSLGRSIRKLADQDASEGLHWISVDISDLASGIYSIILTSSDIRSAKKFIKTK